MDTCFLQDSTVGRENYALAPCLAASALPTASRHFPRAGRTSLFSIRGNYTDVKNNPVDYPHMTVVERALFTPMATRRGPCRAVDTSADFRDWTDWVAE